MRPLLPLLSLPALLWACGGPKTTPPVQVAALTLGNDGTYEARTVMLETILDIVALKGLAAELRGGARIEVDATDPQLQNVGQLTDEKLREILVKNPGLPPRASYITKDGVLYPADFHTWNMTTLYYNYELAFLYFTSVGQVPAEEIQDSLVYYFPEFYLKDGTQTPKPQVDNALWFSLLEGFLVLKFEKFQQLPFAMNQGIVAHEFAHRVFHERVYGGQSQPAPFFAWQGFGASSAINLLKSLDEGFADYHAFLASCRTEFGCTTRSYEASLGAAPTDSRDIAKPDKCMTTTLRDSLNNLDFSTFLAKSLHYEVGTVIGSALYQAGRKRNAHQQYARALLTAYDDSSPNVGLRQIVEDALVNNQPNRVTLARMATSILMHIPEATGLRTELCNQFLDRLQIPRADIDAVDLAACAGSTQDFQCQDINP